MSAILGTAVTGAGGGVYTIDNSLRFRRSASAYLNRTPASAGNRQKFTISMWVKRGDLENRTTLISAGTSSSGGGPGGSIYFNSSGGGYKLEFIGAGGTSYYIYTTQVFFDPSSWYHFVFAFDTTQATSSDRIKAYVNGSQITAFSTASYPSQNFNTDYNNTVIHAIGSRTDDGTPPVSTFDGYMAEIYMVDGQQLTPSSFGATDANTGVWQPKAYSGSYGTNGFYLKFSDIATTSGSNAGLGKDFSGNANYWNTNNISVTAGVTYDAMTDSPTPKSSTVGNYCVLNPLDNTAGSNMPTFYAGNLNISFGNASYACKATMGASGTGKYYFEVSGTNRGGIYNTISNPGVINESGAYWGIQIYNGSINSSTGGSAYNGTAYGSGAWPVIGFAFDLASGKFWIRNDSGWYGSGDPATGANPAYSNLSGTITPWWAGGGGGYFGDHYFNFGQRPFAYTPPTGFVALNTFNLPTPTIGASSTTLANKYFDVSLWTGNGTSQSITNSGSMQPDFVWIKNRSGTWNLPMANSILGGTNIVYSNGTSAIQTDNVVTSFNSNGFTVGVSGNANNNGNSFVGWQWKGNGSGVTNTQGTITATVSANPVSGFSFIRWTGTGSSGTIGHGLGSTPKMIFVKDGSNGYNWYVFTTGNSAGNNERFEGLNTTGGSSTQNSQFTATSTLITNVPGITSLNTSGATMMAYCWAPVAGYSAISYYIGNGSSNGPFVFTGFRPRYIFIKRYGVDNWIIIDTARDTYNQATKTLYANSDQAEENLYNYADILSNGFKLRSSNSGTNQGGENYVYMAFAENPFKYSLAR